MTKASKRGPFGRKEINPFSNPYIHLAFFSAIVPLRALEYYFIRESNIVNSAAHITIQSILFLNLNQVFYDLIIYRSLLLIDMWGYYVSIYILASSVAVPVYYFIFKVKYGISFANTMITIVTTMLNAGELVYMLWTVVSRRHDIFESINKLSGCSPRINRANAFRNGIEISVRSTLISFLIYTGIFAIFWDDLVHPIAQLVNFIGLVMVIIIFFCASASPETENVIQRLTTMLLTLIFILYNIALFALTILLTPENKETNK